MDHKSRRSVHHGCTCCPHPAGPDHRLHPSLGYIHSCLVFHSSASLPFCSLPASPTPLLTSPPRLLLLKIGTTLLARLHRSTRSPRLLHTTPALCTATASSHHLNPLCNPPDRNAATGSQWTPPRIQPQVPLHLPVQTPPPQRIRSACVPPLCKNSVRQLPPSSCSKSLTST